MKRTSTGTITSDSLFLPLLKLSAKQRKRKDHFAKRGTWIGDPDVNDYHTGKESRFKMQLGDFHPMHDLYDDPIAGHPQYRTPQWLRSAGNVHHSQNESNEKK